MGVGCTGGLAGRGDVLSVIHSMSSGAVDALFPGGRRVCFRMSADYCVTVTLWQPSKALATFARARRRWPEWSPEGVETTRQAQSTGGLGLPGVG